MAGLDERNLEMCSYGIAPWQKRQNVLHVVLLLPEGVSICDDFRLDQDLLKLVQHDGDDRNAETDALKPTNPRGITDAFGVVRPSVSILVEPSKMGLDPDNHSFK